MVIYINTDQIQNQQQSLNLKQHNYHAYAPDIVCGKFSYHDIPIFSRNYSILINEYVQFSKLIFKNNKFLVVEISYGGFPSVLLLSNPKIEPQIEGVLSLGQIVPRYLDNSDELKAATSKLLSQSPWNYIPYVC